MMKTTIRHPWSGAVLIAGLLLTAPAAGQQADATSDERVAEVREALGGAKLERITGLSIEGTFRRLMGGREMSGDLEVAIALPDRFLRTEIMDLGPATPVRRLTGFNGDTPIDGFASGPAIPPRPGEGPAGGRALTSEEIVSRQLRGSRREFGRLVAVLLLGSTPTFPLTYQAAGQAESAAGKADVFDIAGPDEFAARLLVDQSSHLPLMLTKDGETVEERQISSVKVNPTFKADKFAKP